MRYLQKFPNDVPHLNVDYSRVTHPYVTVIIPYNLHVLSIPLAFALSQDQTLQLISNQNPKKGNKTQICQEPSSSEPKQ